MKFFLLSALAVLPALLYYSVFEWVFHKYVMHKIFLGYTYPYKAHTLTHHRVFRADKSYHLQDDRDKHTIPMAWWNGPVLIAATPLPALLVSFVTGLWWIYAGFVFTSACYYAAYEYMHWCMHLPRRRIVERRGFFFRLNGHHLLHHRWMGNNFNVVLPLADLVFGTLITQAKFRFEQPRCEALPDVQPDGKPAVNN